MNYLSNLDENYREKLLCYPYSDKARALLLAHFQRLELPPATLAIGRQTCSQKQYHTVSKNPQDSLTIVTNPLRSLSGLWQVKHAQTHLNILVYGKNTPPPDIQYVGYQSTPKTCWPSVGIYGNNFNLKVNLGLPLDIKYLVNEVNEYLYR